MVQLSMVGLMVRDMAASLEFYRRLGLDVPEGSEDGNVVLLTAG